jgi:nucleotidyltransferase substrate binding protein (TIGR01987 family)
MIDYDKFEKSLKNLEEQYNNFLTLDDKPYLSKIDKEGIKESVIQRFEICYDSLYKTLKRYLNEELGVPEMPNSPWPIFQIAFENKLLSNDILQWKKYVQARIGTTHDYSGEKADEAIGLMGSFVSDACELYFFMTGLVWK